MISKSNVEETLIKSTVFHALNLLKYGYLQDANMSYHHGANDYLILVYLKDNSKEFDAYTKKIKKNKFIEQIEDEPEISVEEVESIFV